MPNLRAVLCSLKVPFAGQQNENVKFQRHLKDNTNLKLPEKRGGGGLKMSLVWKITTISCRTDLRALEPVSNSLIFRPLYRMVVRNVLLM